MGLFNNKGEGGMLDVIRCDLPEYLVWKWRPTGANGTTKKENAIRWGSSLRVKEGEVVVFVYKQQDVAMQDFIIGPFDQTIKTANFPVLSNILGAAFGGGSPFQAEIYFINLSGNIQINFGIPFFDVFDPRFLDFGVPVAVRGTLTFNITDYKNFIKLNRLIEFDLDAFKKQTKDAITKYIKGVVTNIPQDNSIPVIQLERKICDINQIIETHLKSRLENDFGVNLKALDIGTIEIDKTSDGYNELKKVTIDQVSRSTIAQNDFNIKNMKDMQEINAGNMSETMRINREEAQRAQKLQTEGANMSAHTLNQQTGVLKTGAESLGQMGNMGTGSEGGMNPAGMMTGMAMGGAMGGQMANMMNNMGQNINSQNQPGQTPPPPPQIMYNVSINGQNTGPYNIQQLQEMVASGQFNKNTHVWKQGMVNWDTAGNVQELSFLFNQQQTPPPPPPPVG